MNAGLLNGQSASMRRPGALAFERLAGVMIARGFLLSLPASAAGFDGSRQGFLLELGAGPALTSKAAVHSIITDVDGNEVGVSTETELGFAGLTRLRLGVGISDRWTITYVNDVVWRDESYYGGLFVTGITGIGATVFHEANAPSWFLEATAGIATVSDLSDFSESGFGAEVGGGYEFARNWLTRLTFGRSWLGDLEDRTTLGLSISRIWY